MSMHVDSEWEAQMEARNRMRCIDDILDDNQPSDSNDGDFIIITNCKPQQQKQQQQPTSTKPADMEPKQQPDSMHSTTSHESLKPAEANPKQANETIFENILKTAAYPFPQHDTPTNNATNTTTTSRSSGGGQGGDTPRSSRRLQLFGRRKRNRSLDSCSPPAGHLDVDEGRRGSKSHFWNSLGCGGGSNGRKSRSDKSGDGKSLMRSSASTTDSNGSKQTDTHNKHNNNNNNSVIQNGRPSQQLLTIDAEKPCRISSTSTDVDEAYQSAQPSPAQSAASCGEQPRQTGSLPASPPSPPAVDGDNDDVVFGLNGVRLSNVVQRLLLCGNGGGSRRSPPKTGSGRAAGKPAAVAEDSTISGANTVRLVAADGCVPADDDRVAAQQLPTAVRRGETSKNDHTSDPSKKSSPRRSTSSSQRSSMLGNELGSIPENLPALGLKLSGSGVVLPLGVTDDVIRRRRSTSGNAVVELPNPPRGREDSSPRPGVSSSKFDSVWNDPATSSDSSFVSKDASLQVVEDTHAASVAVAAVLLESEIDDSPLQIIEVESDVVDRTESTSSSPAVTDRAEQRSRRGVQAEATALQQQQLSRLHTSTQSCGADDRNFPRVWKSRRSSDRGINMLTYVTPIKPCRSEEILRGAVPSKTPPAPTVSPAAATSRRSRTRRSLDGGSGGDGDGWRWVRSSRSTERSTPGGATSDPAAERGKSPLRRRSLSREMKVVVVRTEVEMTEVRRPGSRQSLTSSSVEDIAGINVSRPTSSCSDRSLKSSSLSAADVVAEPEVGARGRGGQYIRRLDVITSTLTEMVRNLEQDAEVKPERNDTSIYNEQEASQSGPTQSSTHVGSNTASLPEDDNDNITDNEFGFYSPLHPDDDIDDLIASLISIAGEDEGGRMTSHTAAAPELPRRSTECPAAHLEELSAIGSQKVAEVEVEMSPTTCAEVHIHVVSAGREPEVTGENEKPETDDFHTAVTSSPAHVEFASDIPPLRASQMDTESENGIQDLLMDLDVDEPKWGVAVDDVTPGTPTSTTSIDTVVAVSPALTTSGFDHPAEVIITSTDACVSVLVIDEILRDLHGDNSLSQPVSTREATSGAAAIHLVPAGREPEAICEHEKPETDDPCMAVTSSTNETPAHVEFASNIPPLRASQVDTESRNGIGDLLLDLDVDEPKWGVAVDDVTPGTPTSTTSIDTVVAVSPAPITSGFDHLAEMVLTSTDAGVSALAVDEVLRELITDSEQEIDPCHGDSSLSQPVSTCETTSSAAADVTSPTTQTGSECRRRVAATVSETVATSVERRQRPELEVTSSAASAQRGDDVYVEKAFVDSIVTSLGTILFLLVVYVLAAFIAYLLKTFVDIQDIS